MTELLTAAQMRAIEQAAISRGDVTGLELMERAGQGVVDAIFAEWPELAPDVSEERGPVPTPPELLGTDETRARRAVVLCGPGNNGGDGFVVARLLYGLGWDVEVFLHGDAGRLPPDARVNCERWSEKSEVTQLDDNVGINFHDFDVVIDAVFGIGLSRGFVVPAAVNFGFHGLMGDGYWCDGVARKPYVVAIDNVSEIDADSGRELAANCDWGGEMGAHLTVTFHRPKVGHYLYDGAMRSGRVAVVDIGLPQVVDDTADNPVLRRRDIVRLPRPVAISLFETSLTKKRFDPDDTGGHKFSHGHAFILSGPMGQGGAARLAARGALRIGAGVVTVGCPPSSLLEHATQLTAVMTRKVDDSDALGEVLADARINALCIGPGLGFGERETALVRAAIPVGGSARHAVFDADALTLISRDSDLMNQLNENCVLTHHAGEFARLFPDIAKKLAAPATKGPAYSKVDATREAAKRAGCVVLYKGPDTVIAHPDGRCSINAALYDREVPWLATAGSGDVLAGFIAGLLARGFDSMQAAETAAWLHVECALSLGPGLIAEDLPEELPKVFRGLGL